jgi:hypothetical protein
MKILLIYSKLLALIISLQKYCFKTKYTQENKLSKNKRKY